MSVSVIVPLLWRPSSFFFSGSPGLILCVSSLIGCIEWNISKFSCPIGRGLLNLRFCGFCSFTAGIDCEINGFLKLFLSWFHRVTYRAADKMAVTPSSLLSLLGPLHQSAARGGATWRAGIPDGGHPFVCLPPPGPLCQSTPGAWPAEHIREIATEFALYAEINLRKLFSLTAI